jgi:hypothetical protein
MSLDLQSAKHSTYEEWRKFQIKKKKKKRAPRNYKMCSKERTNADRHSLEPALTCFFKSCHEIYPGERLHKVILHATLGQNLSELFRRPRPPCNRPSIFSQPSYIRDVLPLPDISPTVGWDSVVMWPQSVSLTHSQRNSFKSTRTLS